MTSMGGLFEPARGGFKSAPLLQPPISTGMTDTLSKLEQIITKSGPVSKAEYTQVSVKDILQDNKGIRMNLAGSQGHED